MKGDITVYYEGRATLICEKAKEHLGLKQGDIIETESRFWEILSYNSSFVLGEINQELENIEFLTNLKWEN